MGVAAQEAKENLQAYFLHFPTLYVSLLLYSGWLPPNPHPNQANLLNEALLSVKVIKDMFDGGTW